MKRNEKKCHFFSMLEKGLSGIKNGKKTTLILNVNEPFTESLLGLDFSNFLSDRGI